MFASQGHLGHGLNGLWDTPRVARAMRLGSVAALSDGRVCARHPTTGHWAVSSWRKTIPHDVPPHLAWTGREGAGARLSWPSMFAEVTKQTTALRPGQPASAHHAPAELRQRAAWRSPAWTVPGIITNDDETNPITEGRLRRFDCSQITMAVRHWCWSRRYLRDHPHCTPDGRINGWGIAQINSSCDKNWTGPPTIMCGRGVSMRWVARR